MDLRLPAPEAAGFANVSGVRIAWASFGHGAADVLVVPTWNFVDSRVSASLVRYLSHEFRVVAYDPRGAGRSDRPPEGYRLEDHLADAIAVMEAAGVARASVVAASLGANQAALLAARHPEQVDRLVLIGAAMAVGTDAPTDDQDAREDDFMVARSSYDGWERWNGSYWRQDWPGFVRWFLEQVFNEPDPDPLIDAMVAIALEADPEILIQQRLEQRRGQDLLAAPAILGMISSPTLVLHGELDLPVSLDVGRAIADAIPEATLAVVIGGGHRPDIRWPELTLPMVRDFLQGHLSTDRPGIDIRAAGGTQ